MLQFANFLVGIAIAASGEQTNVSEFRSRVREYLVDRDPTRLPRIRITPPPKIRNEQRHEPNGEEHSSTDKLERWRSRRIRRNWWTPEDRLMFSLQEAKTNGYCEECSNFGSLHYLDGLYLCDTCKHTLRGPNGSL